MPYQNYYQLYTKVESGPLAILRHVRIDVTRLITLLLLIAQQKTLSLFDIATLNLPAPSLSANRMRI